MANKSVVIERAKNREKKLRIDVSIHLDSLFTKHRDKSNFINLTYHGINESLMENYELDRDYTIFLKIMKFNEHFNIDELTRRFKEDGWVVFLAIVFDGFIITLRDVKDI